MKQKEYTIEGMGIGMAIVDAIPVLLFAGSSIIMGLLFGNLFFMMGAAGVTIGGSCKVIWKLLLAWKDKNVFVLNQIFRVFMIGGFTIMLASVFAVMCSRILQGNGTVFFETIGNAVSKMPQGALFLLGTIGMICMGVFAKTLDKTKAKSNWIEQITNAVAQGCFLVGLLLVLF